MPFRTSLAGQFITCGKMSRLQIKKCLLTYKDPLKRPHISHRKCFLCLGKLQFGYFQLFQRPSVNNKVHKTINTVPTVTISWIKKNARQQFTRTKYFIKKKTKTSFLHLFTSYIFLHLQPILTSISRFQLFRFPLYLATFIYLVYYVTKQDFYKDFFQAFTLGTLRLLVEDLRVN